MLKLLRYLLVLLIVAPISISAHSLIDRIIDPHQEVAAQAAKEGIDLIKAQGFNYHLGNGCNGYHLVAFLDEETLDKLWSNWDLQLQLSLASENNGVKTFDKPNDLVEGFIFQVKRANGTVKNSRAFNKDTPLSIAMYLGRSKQAEIFLKYGADYTYINNSGGSIFNFTPFTNNQIFDRLISDAQSKGILQELLSTPSNNKVNILHNAGRAGNKYAYEKLIELGMNPAQPDLGGNTPEDYFKKSTALYE